MYPPASWFEHPGDIPTDRRVTITADGRVYGYVALWDQCHLTMGGCVNPPKGSPTDYRMALTGETQTEDGTMVATANIGGGAGHANPKVDPNVAAEFYANTATQLMRVVYGEDEKGVWFAGALWPDVGELDIAHIRASAISGDWRPVALWRRGQSAYDFVGSCFVNVGGYATENEGQISGESGTPMMIAAAAGARADDIVVIDAGYALAMNDETNTSTDEKNEGGCSCGGEGTVQAATGDAPVAPAMEMLADMGAKLDNLSNMVVGLVEANVLREASAIEAEVAPE